MDNIEEQTQQLDISAAVQVELLSQISKRSQKLRVLEQQVDDLQNTLGDAQRQRDSLQQLVVELEQIHRELEVAHNASQQDKERLTQLEAAYNASLQDKEQLVDQVRHLDTKLNNVLSSHTWRLAIFYWRIAAWIKKILRTLRNLPLSMTRAIYQAVLPYDLRSKIWRLRKRESRGPGSQIQHESPISQVVKTLPEKQSPRSFDVIVLSIIEYAGRYQRPQQIAAHFARVGHRVFYVSASKFIPQSSTVLYQITTLEQGILEVNLATDHTPAIYSSIVDADNQECFTKSLGALRRDHGIHAALLVVHLPFWTPLALALREKHGWAVNYDCMDEWDGFPLIGKEIIKAEQQLIRESDLVTVTAQLLYQKWCGQAQKCVLVRNAVDAKFFGVNVRPNILLNDLKHPIIGFYGGIAEWIDLELLEFLAQRRPDWNIFLLGDTFVDVSALEKLTNVYLLGRQPYEIMPQYLYHFDVCLIPFRKNDITNAVDPVKFYEYISAGKPVVATRIDELLYYEDYLYLASDHAEFLAKIEQALAENDPELIRKRIKLAQANDWQDRIVLIEKMVSTHFPKISIIIVTYQNVELTRLCVESIFRNTTYPHYEVILVDNASTDGTRTYLRFLMSTHSGALQVILNDTNVGFAAANNQGIEAVSGERIILLNNDTVVPRGWLWNLNRYLDRPEIGMVGPVTNSTGNEARIDVDYVDLNNMENFADRHMRDHEGIHFDINVLAMYCVGIRRDVIEKVGLLDTQFGIGMFEDDDYSERVRQAGYRVVCAEDIFVHHFGMAAFKKLVESGEYQAIWNRNQDYFEQKWGKKWTPHKPR